MRYDIYGPDVVIANKMESNGQEGNVQVSEVTKDLVERSFPGQFHYHKFADVETKFKVGKIQGFLVSK